jgi:hypothetical protein
MGSAFPRQSFRGFWASAGTFLLGTDGESTQFVMKRIWAWLSELFASAEPVAVTRHVIARDTPPAPWSLSQVEELRWA